MGFLKPGLFTRRCGAFAPQTLLWTGEDARRSIVNLVRDHSHYFLIISVADQHGVAQFLLALLRFGGQDVAQIRLVTLDFPRPGFLEALGSAFVCF
jgi:hypothetical protein